MDENFARRIAWFREHVESGARGVRGDEPAESDREARLRGWLRLDPTQMRFVLACACVATDPHVQARLVELGGPDARRGLSLATYDALVDAPTAALAHWLASGPRLVQLGLLSPALDGLVVAATPFRPANRVVSFLFGSDAIDLELARTGGLVHVPERHELDRARKEGIDRLATLLGTGRPALVVVVGPRGSGRRTAVAVAAAHLGRSTVALDGLRGTLAQVYALHREAILLEAIPVVADADQLARDGELTRELARALDDAPGTCVVTTTDAGFTPQVSRPVIRLRLGSLGVDARAAVWTNELARIGAGTDVARELAMRYQLGPGAIHAAASVAHEASTEPRVALPELVAGVRATIANRFGTLAERLDVTDRWDDVVLPSETRDQIDALVARVRHAYRVLEEWGFPRTTARGGGVAALFSGPPGTGKTHGRRR